MSTATTLEAAAAGTRPCIARGGTQTRRVCECLFLCDGQSRARRSGKDRGGLAVQWRRSSGLSGALSDAGKFLGDFLEAVLRTSRAGLMIVAVRGRAQRRKSAVD